jgi:receptor protein-tyrosine kinase
MLVERGKLASYDIQRVLDWQQKRQLRFGEAALQLGLLGASDLEQVLRDQYDLPSALAHDTPLHPELVMALQPTHVCAEQIRTVRAELSQRLIPGQDGLAAALAVVSPQPGDGRSWLAANLALAWAQLGRRTLLVDADLRRPRQHLLFGVPDHIGLAGVLGGRADRSAVQPLRHLGPLCLLSAGGCPPNPLDLFTRDAWRHLLRLLRGEFEVVVLDTPAASRGADAVALACSAGHALVVARQHATRLDRTEQLLQRLQCDGTRVAGVLLNAG